MLASIALFTSLKANFVLNFLDVLLVSLKKKCICAVLLPTVRHKQLHLKIAVLQHSRLLLALRGKMARRRFSWERRDEFVEQQHRAHHPWKSQKLFSVYQTLNFWIKHLRCYCEAMHTAQINETTPKQQSPRGAFYPKLSYFLTTQRKSVKNWNISSTKIWCVLSYVFEICCCMKLNVPESWNSNHGIYSIKQTMSFLKHRDIFRRSSRCQRR